MIDNKYINQLLKTDEEKYLAVSRLLNYLNDRICYEGSLRGLSDILFSKRLNVKKTKEFLDELVSNRICVIYQEKENYIVYSNLVQISQYLLDVPQWYENVPLWHARKLSDNQGLIATFKTLTYHLLEKTCQNLENDDFLEIRTLYKLLLKKINKKKSEELALPENQQVFVESEDSTIFKGEIEEKKKADKKGLSEEENLRFEKAWKYYSTTEDGNHLGRGSKSKAREQLIKLSQANREKAFHGILCHATIMQHKFRKHLDLFLRDKLWEQYEETTYEQAKSLAFKRKNEELNQRSKESDIPQTTLKKGQRAIIW